jgi:hypothetical protein
VRKAIVFCLLGFALCLSIAGGAAAEPAQGAAVAPAPDFGRVPLYFISNQGQADAEALFYAKTPAYSLWLTRQGLLFDEARLVFRGARRDVSPAAIDPADYVVSYFDGRDESDWHTGIPTSKAVLYKDLYEGIDLKVYGTEKVVEYDWVVKPGADPGRIAFGYEGGASVRLTPEGDLVVETAKGTLKHRRPASYQVIDGAKVEVASSFRTAGDGTFGFELGPYDRGRELVIDPLVLVFSTYLGGTMFDEAYGVGVDASGAIFVTGYTDSLDFPPRTVRFPRRDAFIAKFAPDGKSLVYTAFFPVGFGKGITTARTRARLGSGVYASGKDLPGFRIFMMAPTGSGTFAVDASGAAYLCGMTSNNHFPIKNALQPEYGGGWWDGFFLKLDPSGRSLVFSSFYGGSIEEGLSALALGPDGAVYLAGGRQSMFRIFVFPIGAGNGFDRKSLDRHDRLFLSKINADGQTELYLKPITVSGYNNSIIDIAVDAAGAVYGVGTTSSLDLPVKNAFQRKLAGGFDSFYFKLAPSGEDFSYFGYLGGANFDYGEAIAVDGEGAAYVAGTTMGTVPVKNAFRNTRAGGIDGYLAKIAPDGRALVFSTYLGGEGADYLKDVILDESGRIYITGETGSAYFPVKDAFKSVRTGSFDGFLTVFKPDGRSLDFSTYFGGSFNDGCSAAALDADGGIYLTGHTTSRDLPLLNPYQAGYAGGWWDAFVVKLKR